MRRRSREEEHVVMSVAAPLGGEGRVGVGVEDGLQESAGETLGFLL